MVYYDFRLARNSEVGWKNKQLARLAMDALQGKESAAMYIGNGVRVWIGSMGIGMSGWWTA